MTDEEIEKIVDLVSARFEKRLDRILLKQCQTIAKTKKHMLHSKRFASAFFFRHKAVLLDAVVAAEDAIEEN